MSEYIIGDRIEPSAQPYTLTAADLEAVGIRVYGDSNGVGYPIQGYEGYYAAASITMDDKAGLMSVGSAALDEGEHQDVFEWAFGVPPTPPDLDHPTAIKDGMATLSTSDTIRMIGGATEGAQPQPILAPFSFIYEGGTHMTTVTERIAKITVSGSETVKFNPVYPVIAIKGDNIDATLIKDIAADATEGVYSTSDGDGYTIIDNHACKDTLYLSGTGDVRIWGGTDANKCPFTSDITGGEEQPWQPLQDGYSNFWFELTNDTLSPWLNFSAKNNDAVIDWGDGSGEVALDTLTPTHTYSKAGKYVVKVKGVTGLAVQHTIPYQGEYLTVLRAIETNAEVVTAAQYAFAYCSGLLHVSLSALTLASYMFYRSGALFDMQIASNEAQIPIRCFNGCYALQNVNLPQSVANINVYAFTACVSLQNITIPSGVTNLGNYAFQTCSSLQEVHILATTPPAVYTYTFDGLPSDFIIYVPVGTGDTYKSASGWSVYADHILEEGTRMSASQLRKIQNEIKTEGEEKI